jgi:hypothetical protein
MIEIVYNRKTAEKDAKLNTSYKMPKNIRQIGTAPDKKKIYIEDYVMTFLRKIAEPGNTSARGAILLGQHFRDEDMETIFISGAIEAQNLEFDVEQIKFDDHVWSDLYAEINKYFENLSVVGWFLSRMGFSTDINEGISRIHRSNFKNSGSVLFVMDSLECEDAFYMWEKGQLVKQRGYYIYYVRNEPMQNYIISRKNTVTEEKSREVLRKDAEIVKNFREMRTDKKDGAKKGKSYFVYAASSFFIVFALSMGIVVTGSYDKMKNLESVVKQIEEKNDTSGVQVFSNNNATISNTEYEEENNNGQVSSDNTTAANSGQVSADETNSENSTGHISSDEESSVSENDSEVNYSTSEAGSLLTEEVMATGQNVLKEYVIEEGDTLMSISLKMYDSPNYVENIMIANDIKEGDTIYPGQKISIPYIQ